MKFKKEDLKEILVGSGLISVEDFEEAAQNAEELGKEISDVLIFRGLIDDKTLAELISKHLNVPYADLRRRSIPDEVLALIPEKMAKNYRVVPFELDGEKLSLAMEDPNNFEAYEFVKRQTGLKIVQFYSTSEDITKVLGQYKRNIKDDFQKIIKENVKKVTPGSSNLERAAEEVPIVKIMDTILTFAVTERASDVHIEGQQESVVVRYRIDGALKDIVFLPKSLESALIARIKILSDLKIDEHRIPQDGRYKFVMDDEIIALRISIIPGFYGENVVMRILKESARPLSLEELGISGQGLELLRENITRPHGMILVTGPTGSGKTTTLYSILNILNTIDVKICTIEDPIEYGIGRVNQVQVNQKTGLTFAAGLRAFLRHDPDIIMVGEIRDQETAEIAVNAALTGHLVLSTLHTNTASGAIPRFIEMGVEGFLLASTLNIVISQRLVRKLCNSCVVRYDPKPEILRRISKEFGIDIKNQKFYKGEGCNECGNKGYSGRIGIYEILPVSESLRELITNRATSEEIQKKAVGEGMITMLQDGLDKVSSGLTTIEEVLRVAREN
jgi:type IV pilus assembly protein PilB